jgi:hypothetical protein
VAVVRNDSVFSPEAVKKPAIWPQLFMAASVTDVVAGSVPGIVVYEKDPVRML